VRPSPLIVVALLVALAAFAWVREPAAPDPYSVANLERLLDEPLERLPGSPLAAPSAPGAGREAFWEVLRAPPFAETGNSGPSLRLGRLLADPTRAARAAREAGALLDCPALGPDGPLGQTLAEAILASPAIEHGAQHTLKIYGCRHAADADSGPGLEDSYFARKALAAGLRERVGDGAPLTILGEETPLKGGINLDVRLEGELQTIEVTFDGSDTAPLRAERAFVGRGEADAGARAHLVEVLRRRAAQGEPLRIEGADEPVPTGVELRLEWFGGHLAITALRGPHRISTHLALLPEASAGEVPSGGATSSGPETE